MQEIEFTLNGEAINLEVGGGEILLSVLRDKLGITSVKEGCGIGECGTCTVLIDNRPHYACLTLAAKVQGRDVKTVEYLHHQGLMHPLQEAFISRGAVQCGYCTPGMLLSAYSLLLENKSPGRQEIKEAISGNLCRCTGYLQVVEAIEDAAGVVQRQEGDNPPVTRTDSSGSGRAVREASITFRGSQPQVMVPRNKTEALSWLSDREDLTIIAGGTDLLIELRRLGKITPLLDVAGLKELSDIQERNGSIGIGSAVTHSRIAGHPGLQAGARSLSLACGWIGSPQIRNMATIGGNLANASPAADSIPPLLIHNAVLTLEAGDQKRTCGLEDFITAPYRSRLQSSELLTEIDLEPLNGYREGYERVIKRAAWALSRVSLAWAIRDEAGVFEDVRLAVGSCTPVPFRAAKAEAFLKGKPKEREIIVEAAAMVIRDIEDISGQRPSFAYKIPVVRGLLEKVLGGR